MFRKTTRLKVTVPRFDVAIENNPADRWQIDVRVAFSQTVPKPDNSDGKVCAPRQRRDACRLPIDLDCKYLWNGHGHGEDGQAPHQTFNPFIIVGCYALCGR
jgi:hypothetical protein